MALLRGGDEKGIVTVRREMDEASAHRFQSVATNCWQCLLRGSMKQQVRR
jgi:hypothetical protein